MQGGGEAQWLVLSGTLLIQDNKVTEAEKLLEGLSIKVELLNKQPITSARTAERMAMIRISTFVRLGTCQMMQAKDAKALETAAKNLEQSLTLSNEMLRVQPLSFPYQAQKITALGYLAIANRRLKRGEAVTKNLEELSKLEAEMMKQNSTLFWIRSMSLNSRAFELYDRVKQGEAKNVLADAAALATDDATTPIQPEIAYNLACIVAMASKYVEEKAQKSQYHQKAVEFLQLAAKRGFFKSEANKELFKKDPDLDELRTSEVFLQFKP